MVFLLAWFRLVMLRGEWPDWFVLSIMALLPKPGAGRGLRTVAKPPLLYRVWIAARRDGIKLWETDICLPWGMARKGGSALTGAMDRATRAEVGLRTGQSVVAICWEFAKFFDTIVPPIVGHACFKACLSHP